MVISKAINPLLIFSEGSDILTKNSKKTGGVSGSTFPSAL